MIALLLAAAFSAQAARQERFVELLRTYPERPPAETFRLVAQLIEEGPFAERDRAEYWIGSARLAAGDRPGAREWFERVGRDYPGSVWQERSWLGMGDAAAQEHRYGLALHWYARAHGAADSAVSELARIAARQIEVLRARQRLAWAAGLFALVVLVFFAVSFWRARGALWPMPAEARILLPVLAVLALLSVKVDPAPRAAVLQTCAGGALLVFVSGLRLRALRPRGLRKALHLALALLAMASLAYAAIYRADMAGLALETFRVGPE